LRFPTIYTGRQSWDDIRADLNKVAEKQGFQLTVHNTKHIAQATSWTLSCTRHRMAEKKVCKRVYDYPDTQFAFGMKVTTVKKTDEQSSVDQLASTNPVKRVRHYPQGKKVFFHSKSTYISTRRTICFIYPKMDL
jgi:hypothetical protein